MINMASSTIGWLDGIGGGEVYRWWWCVCVVVVEGGGGTEGKCAPIIFTIR